MADREPPGSIFHQFARPHTANVPSELRGHIALLNSTVDVSSHLIIYR